MTRCDYYWFIGTFQGEYRIDGSVLPSATSNIIGAHGEWKLAVYVGGDGLPFVARLSIPGLASEELPETHLPTLQIVKEHVGSVLRLLHGDRGIAKPLAMWNFRPNDSAPDLQVEISEEVGHGSFDPGLFNGMFSNTIATREELRLYLDGTDERIPLQYRFLSLYKILELRFTKNGVWQENELSAELEPHAKKLEEIGVKKSLRNYLAELRDKCAHIKTLGRKVEMAVTHLNHKQLAEVQKAVPILAGVCRTYLNRTWAGKVTIEEPNTASRVLRSSKGGDVAHSDPRSRAPGTSWDTRCVRS